MALNRSDKSRILRRYFPGMTRNSEMSTEPSNSANLFSQSFLCILPLLPKGNRRHQDRRRDMIATLLKSSRSLAGKPLAGFCVTQSRRIPV